MIKSLLVLVIWVAVFSYSAQEHPLKRDLSPEGYITMTSAGMIA